MINLHVIYYRNIWPFEDKECSLLFQQGKFLIKAPIGSGKSFLFFDGPTYALYRTANRNMLNIKSTEGEISLIFSEGENYYLVRRMLKPGKSKDSCSSQLFSLVITSGATSEANQSTPDMLTELLRRTLGSSSQWFDDNEILQRNVNIINELTMNNAFHLEEIVMKNETDLQQSLDQLLPPKSVFLSTMFLLQDADNIFEMQPADRLTVLKNVFGLLGIDEAKEQVQDKKREISYKLKALQDHSHQDAKLRKFLKSLHNDYLSLQRSSLQAERSNLKHFEDFFTPIEWLLDHITLNDFTLNGLDIQLCLSLQEALQTKEKSLLTLQTSKAHLQQQIKEHTDQLLQQEQEKRKLTSTIEELDKNIASIDTKKIEQLKQEKATHYATQTSLEAGSNLFRITHSETISTLLGELPEKKEGLSAIVLLIQTLKDCWKDLANQIQQAELQLKNAELETKNQQLKTDQLEQAKKRLAEFEINLNEQASFACKEIWTNCPFIKVINKQHFEQLEKQKSVLKEEITQLEQHINISPKDDSRIPQNCEVPRPNGEAVNLHATIQHHQQQIDRIKTFLTNINYKSREEKYEQQETLQKQITQLDQAIMQLEIQTQKLHDYQQQKTALQTSLQEKGQQSEQLKMKNEELKAEREALEQQINQQQPEQLKTQLQTVANILQILHDIQQLIADTTATKNLVKELQQQEKLLANLYTILSKEILLIALEEYLPVLSEIINSFLAQVVDYQISLKIMETAEKLELEAKIYDEKGEREVKSLSGGQRTILKLVWMLAISSYLRTPLLFLDETINNLDTETVGKVSEMLNNFVKQRTMKFYTVTHNTDIQAMEIWDRVVEV